MDGALSSSPCATPPSSAGRANKSLKRGALSESLEFAAVDSIFIKCTSLHFLLHLIVRINLSMYHKIFLNSNYFERNLNVFQ